MLYLIDLQCLCYIFNRCNGFDRWISLSMRLKLCSSNFSNKLTCNKTVCAGLTLWCWCYSVFLIWLLNIIVELCPLLRKECYNPHFVWYCYNPHFVWYWFQVIYSLLVVLSQQLEYHYLFEIFRNSIFVCCLLQFMVF